MEPHGGLVPATLLDRLAGLGVWKFQYYDPHEFRTDSVVVGAEGAYELEDFINTLVQKPSAYARVATEVLGIVAGEGGSGWKHCLIPDLQYLYAGFVQRYGAVHKIPDYPPLDELNR